MKTAISIPDDTFNEVERHAAELGMSRSEFFTTAARHYIQELDAQSLTARINAAVAVAGSDEPPKPQCAQAGVSWPMATIGDPPRRHPLG